MRDFMVYAVNSKLKQAYYLANKKKKGRRSRMRRRKNIPLWENVQPIRLFKYFCSCDFTVLFR
jgi:hypothetical protein